MSASTTLSGNAGTTALGAVGAGTPCEECAEQSDAVPHPDACCRFVTTTESTDSPTDLRTHNGQSSRPLKQNQVAVPEETSGVPSRAAHIRPKTRPGAKHKKTDDWTLDRRRSRRARTLRLQKGSIEEIHTEFVAMGIYTSKSTLLSVEPVGDETCPQNTTMPRKTQRADPDPRFSQQHDFNRESCNTSTRSTKENRATNKESKFSINVSSQGESPRQRRRRLRKCVGIQ